MPVHAGHGNRVAADPGPGRVAFNAFRLQTETPVRIPMLLLMATLAACSSLQRTQHFVVEKSDYSALAYQSLKYIEMRGAVERFVIGPDVGADARNGLRGQRPLTSSTVGAPENAIVPAGTFVVTRFDIADGEATLEGILGTSRPAGPCNLTFSIPWFLQPNNDWYNPSYKIESCDRRVEVQ